MVSIWLAVCATMKWLVKLVTVRREGDRADFNAVTERTLQLGDRLMQRVDQLTQRVDTLQAGYDAANKHAIECDKARLEDAAKIADLQSRLAVVETEVNGGPERD